MWAALGVAIIAAVWLWMPTHVFAQEELELVEIHPSVRISEPLPGADVSSPLRVAGEARGTWYFEADFPIRLFDMDGNELAVTIAMAQEPWMTEDFVPFEAVLEFDAPTDACLVLVLQKDNPSDLRELDDEARMGLRCELEK
jgi:hypothetical protein